MFFGYAGDQQPTGKSSEQISFTNHEITILIHVVGLASLGNQDNPDLRRIEDKLKKAEERLVEARKKEKEQEETDEQRGEGLRGQQPDRT